MRLNRMNNETVISNEFLHKPESALKTLDRKWMKDKRCSSIFLPVACRLQNY
jgi:hypothetical protein